MFQIPLPFVVGIAGVEDIGKAGAFARAVFEVGAIGVAMPFSLELGESVFGVFKNFVGIIHFVHLLCRLKIEIFDSEFRDFFLKRGDFFVGNVELFN